MATGAPGGSFRSRQPVPRTSDRLLTMPVGESNGTRPSLRIRLSGLLVSFAMSGLVVLAFPIVGPAPVTTFLVPPLMVAIAAFAFAALNPGRPLLWGPLLSSGFWAYFLVVFIAYLSTGEWHGVSIVRALTVLAAGILGAVAAARTRRIPVQR
jgi:hypothetical protein